MTNLSGTINYNFDSDPFQAQTLSLNINKSGVLNIASGSPPTPVTYELANTLTGSGGTINISQFGTLQLDFAASGVNIVFGDATGNLTIEQLSTFGTSMRVLGLQAGDTIAIPHLPSGFKELYNPSTGVLTLQTSVGGALGTITFAGASLPTLTTVQNAVVICFASGTRIATPDGETPVEALKTGDRVRLRDGGVGEIEWVG